MKIIYTRVQIVTNQTLTNQSDSQVKLPSRKFETSSLLADHGKPRRRTTYPSVPMYPTNIINLGLDGYQHPVYPINAINLGLGILSTSHVP